MRYLHYRPFPASALNKASFIYYFRQNIPFLSTIILFYDFRPKERRRAERSGCEAFWRVSAVVLFRESIIKRGGIYDKNLHDFMPRRTHICHSKQAPTNKAVCIFRRRNRLMRSQSKFSKREFLSTFSFYQ